MEKGERKKVVHKRHKYLNRRKKGDSTNVVVGIIIFCGIIIGGSFLLIKVKEKANQSRDSSSGSAPKDIVSNPTTGSQYRGHEASSNSQDQGKTLLTSTRTEKIEADYKKTQTKTPEEENESHKVNDSSYKNLSDTSNNAKIDQKNQKSKGPEGLSDMPDEWEKAGIKKIKKTNFEKLVDTPDSDKKSDGKEDTKKTLDNKEEPPDNKIDKNKDPDEASIQEELDLSNKSISHLLNMLESVSVIASRSEIIEEIKKRDKKEVMKEIGKNLKASQSKIEALCELLGSYEENTSANLVFRLLVENADLQRKTISGGGIMSETSYLDYADFTKKVYSEGIYATCVETLKKMDKYGIKGMLMGVQGINREKAEIMCIQLLGVLKFEGAGKILYQYLKINDPLGKRAEALASIALVGPRVCASLMPYSDHPEYGKWVRFSLRLTKSSKW